MAGQWRAATTKPSRSDEIPDLHQQLEIANLVRSHFDSLAPKRPAKPNRSEPDTVLHADDPREKNNSVDVIPEFNQFRSLLSQSQVKFIGEGGYDTVQDEFVETEYYKELAAVDKQHYTTGSGFIREMNEGGEEINISGAAHVMTSGGAGRGFRSNPATNDWVPAVDEHQVFVSCKPNRSESS